MRRPRDLDHGRVGRELARDELVRLQDRQHLLDARRSPRAAAPRAARARRSRRSRSPRGPGVTSAAQPASSRRATTSSTCSGVARRAHHDQQLGCAGDSHRSQLRQNQPRHGRIADPWPTPREARGLLRHPADRPEDARQLQRRLSPVRADAGDAATRFFCIVDLHSITRRLRPGGAARRSTLDLAAMLFATGLDAERSTVFCQSHVTAHAEAAWLLSAVDELRPAGPHDAVQGEVRRAASSSRPGSSRTPC